MPEEPKKIEEDNFQEAKELFKEGLKKIFQATKKASEKVVEGFREGYAEDVTRKKELTLPFPRLSRESHSNRSMRKLSSTITKKGTVFLPPRFSIKLFSEGSA